MWNTLILQTWPEISKWDILWTGTVSGTPSQSWWWLFSGGDLVTQSCPALATPWTVAHQSPLSMGFFRQEYWSGLPFLSLGDLFAMQAGSLQPGHKRASPPTTPPQPPPTTIYTNNIMQASALALPLLPCCPPWTPHLPSTWLSLWKCWQYNSFRNLVGILPIFIPVML